MPEKVLVNLATGLEDPERVMIAFLVCTAALAKGDAVAMFLTKDAVRLALPGHAEGIACDGCPPLKRLFGQYAEGGGELIVCPICFDARGLDQSALSRTRGWAEPHRCSTRYPRETAEQLLDPADDRRPPSGVDVGRELSATSGSECRARVMGAWHHAMQCSGAVGRPAPLRNPASTRRGTAGSECRDPSLAYRPRRRRRPARSACAPGARAVRPSAPCRRPSS